MIGDLLAGDPPQLGPYRLLGRLGAGGMGQVYLGRSAGGRLVAVKVIRPDLAEDADFGARFAQEVSAARRVSGLFTAAVVDADIDGPTPWLATAYVPGPSLAATVQAHGPLPAGSLLPLTAGLAEGLAAVHVGGVVHRDLKPANVMLAEDGPRVIDFGISRAADATSLTRSGVVVGSPGFMSPEQAEGGRVGPPSDVFSLGAVIAFAATGQSPFGTGPTPALVYRVVHAEPDIGALHGEIRQLVERCLAKDPAERPTAAEVLAEAGAAQPFGDWLPAKLAAALSEHRAQLSYLADAPSGGGQQERAPTEPAVSAGGLSTVTSLRARSAVPGPAPSQQSDAGTTGRERKWRLPGWGWAVVLVLVLAAAGAAAAGVASGPGAAPASSQAAAHLDRSSAPATKARTAPTRSQYAGRARVPHNTEERQVLRQSVSPTGPYPAAPPPAGAPSSAPPGTPSSAPVSTSPPATSPQVPVITSVGTYTEGELVYFDIHYTDPDNEAEGFGFVGVNGSGWAEENHPFSSPSYGIVGPDSIAYPFNEACGTAQQYDSYVDAWIYDTAGNRSKAVVIELACTD